MKHRYPPEYAQFRCIGGSCPDSCCTGWEIVIDQAQEAYYRTVPGELGERLQRAMVVDADGDTIFRGDSSDCPFWNQAHLCQLQLAYGENALCETCREFPRITQDYEQCREHDISIACPEAARLLLKRTPEQLTFIEEIEDTGDSPVAYDLHLWEMLWEERELLFAQLRDTSQSAVAQLAECLHLSSQWEQQPMHVAQPFSVEACIAFLRSCSILQPSWDTLLEQAASAWEKGKKLSFPEDNATDSEVRAFAFDMLYRHYLRAVSDDMAGLRVQMTAFLVLAGLLLISLLDMDTQEKRISIWQRLVKEVEYDSDNLYLLQDTLCMEASFSCGALQEALLHLW